MSRVVQDHELCQSGDQLKGQTVIITGGASGIGREAALLFARYEAKVVIGDLNAKAAEEVAAEIVRRGGQALWRKCDVLEYDEQRQIFEAAYTTFGSVDVVIPCAGLPELHPLLDIKLDAQGYPIKPNTKVFDVDFLSVVYSSQLAYYYFQKFGKQGGLNTLVIVASILGLHGLQRAPMYSLSKHALIAFMRSLHSDFETSGFRIVAACPWFIDTPLVPQKTRKILMGMPMVPLDRVVNMLVFATTDRTQGSNGAAYTAPDSGLIFRMMPEDFSDEVEFTKIIARRVRDEHRQLIPESVMTAVVVLRIFAVPLTGLLMLTVAGKYVLRFL